MPDDHAESHGEGEALRRLRQPVEPSAAHARTVRELLRQRGAFRRPGAGWGMPLAIAASLLIGLMVGRQTRSDAVAAATGDEYVFVLLNHPAPTWPRGTTEGQIVNAYREWSGRLARAGQLSVAEELDSARIVVDSAGPRRGEFAGGFGGFFLVRADDDSAAAVLAASLPHVRQGGAVAIQRVTTR